MKKGIKRNRLANVKLNKILENTTTIKQEIEEVTKEKKKAIEIKEEIKTKKQEQVKKAQDKFVRVGTKLNEEDLIKFNTRIEELSLNQSQYIKKLIEIEVDYNLFSLYSA